MHAKSANESKRPFAAQRPFPWRCRHCGKSQVVMSTMSYDAEVRHDGSLYTFTIPRLHIPVCQACAEKVFTEKVDEQINAALRARLRLLAPEDMRAALERLGMTQKEDAGLRGFEHQTRIPIVRADVVVLGQLLAGGIFDDEEGVERGAFQVEDADPPSLILNS